MTVLVSGIIWAFLPRNTAEQKSNDVKIMPRAGPPNRRLRGASSTVGVGCETFTTEEVIFLYLESNSGKSRIFGHAEKTKFGWL